MKTRSIYSLCLAAIILFGSSCSLGAQPGPSKAEKMAREYILKNGYQSNAFRSVIPPLNSITKEKALYWYKRATEEKYSTVQ